MPRSCSRPPSVRSHARGQLAGDGLRRPERGHHEADRRRAQGQHGERAGDLASRRPGGEHRARAGRGRPGEERHRLHGPRPAVRVLADEVLAGRQVLAQQMLERHQPHEDHEARPHDPLHRRRVPASRRCAARPGAAATPAGRRGSGRECYGVVVDSVNVSVFEYAPVRSASLAPIGCLNAMSTRLVGRRSGPRRLRERHLQRLRQGERPVGQVRRVRRDRQRRVTGRGDDVGRGARLVRLGDTRRERPERGGRARASATTSRARCRRRCHPPSSSAPSRRCP